MAGYEDSDFTEAYAPPASFDAAVAALRHRRDATRRCAAVVTQNIQGHEVYHLARLVSAMSLERQAELDFVLRMQEKQERFTRRWTRGMVIFGALLFLATLAAVVRDWNRPVDVRVIATPATIHNP